MSGTEEDVGAHEERVAGHVSRVAGEREQAHLS